MGPLRAVTRRGRADDFERRVTPFGLTRPTDYLQSGNAMPRSATKRAIEFSAEALANIRQRYVETSESMDRIAADFNVYRDTIRRLAARQG